jgi:hypothetical protein
MSHDYNIIPDMGYPQTGPQFQQQQPPQQFQQQPQFQQQQPPQQFQPQFYMNGPPQFDRLKQYLSQDDSDNSDDEEETSSGFKYWHHVYGLATLILLALILFFVIKIKKDINSIYEDA